MVNLQLILGIGKGAPFWIITLFSFYDYLKKGGDKRKHIFYAFFFFSIGFAAAAILNVVLVPGMSESDKVISGYLAYIFDCCNLIGLFWLFVFLTDFVDYMKKYIKYAAVHLIISLIIILALPVDIVPADGDVPMLERQGIKSIMLLSFWFLYWSIIAYQFWKHSGLMTRNVAIRRSQMMSIGAVFAIIAYIFIIISATQEGSARAILFFASNISAALCGIVLYLGFCAPAWLKAMWRRSDREKISES
ncbi:MAG: hypothetical protein A7316_03335 [Candidatus Altiarchaeales archaeon WOR_SM1_86-2]|nr:MAG: hypothetical protein A7316_03335 [Candidatus Altiarchaeales archaeon WOR_SM1_86-2]